MSQSAKRFSELSEERQALLALLLKKEGLDSALGTTIPRRPNPGDAAPLSFGQQRLWFLDQLAPGNPFYNLSTAVHFDLAINAPALKQSVNEVVRRHESLRTTFEVVQGEPMQVIAPSLTIELPVIDLRELAPAAKDAEALKLATEEAQRPFDLATGPLLRTTLLRLDQAAYLFMLSMHHIISDAWSMGLFTQEVTLAYQSIVSGRRAQLGDLPIQYADFATWQRQGADRPELEEHLTYWTNQLAQLPTLQMPTDRLRPATPSFRGAEERVDLPESLVVAVRALAQRQGVTLFMTLLAAFSTLLQRYSSQDEIVIGSPIAGRDRPELEDLIGFFVNTLVLRVDHSGDPTFLELLERVRQMTVDAYAHQDTPFEKLVEVLQPERDLSRNPLCQVAFQSYSVSSVKGQAETTRQASALNVERGSAVFDIVFTLVEDAGTIGGKVEYSTELFDRQTIQRFIGYFKRLLAEIVEDPSKQLSAYRVLSSAEWQRIVLDPNATTVEFPENVCIHQVFEDHAKRRANETALIFEDRQITYSELNRRANQLAHYLRSLGVRPGTLVGLCVERGVEMIVGLLGVLKSGGAFVPLDPAYPKHRLAFMVSDAQVSVLLTTSGVSDRLPVHEAEVIRLDDDWPMIARHSDANPPINVSPESLAYAIYTSGSTGRPKGVLVAHKGLVNVAASQARILGVDASSRVLQFSSLSFDASIFEFVMAYFNGATLCLGSKETLMPGPGLLRFLKDKRVTVVTLPPSALTVLPIEPLPALKTITVAGEACPAALVESWAPGRKFFNLYGPTEGTIWTTVAECQDGGGAPPIGYPIGNSHVYVLDRHLNPVPAGVPGELCIGGVGLAMGYLNRASLTAEKFIPNPFSDEVAGDRLYRTGDLVRFVPEAGLQYLGRLDDQVKIRGYRIEPGEIEAALRTHEAVREAIVLAADNGNAERRMVAYAVTRSGSAITAAELRSFLRQMLPDFMIPSDYVILDALPLMPSGKVDRQALAKLKSQPAEAVLFVPPQSGAQRLIAEIWGEVLDTQRIGLHDNFFDLGGHSLLMAKVQIRLEQATGEEISIIDLFRYPTVESLAKHLSDAPAEPVAIEQVQERVSKQKAALRRRRQRIQNRRRSGGLHGD